LERRNWKIEESDESEEKRQRRDAEDAEAHREEFTTEVTEEPQGQRRIQRQDATAESTVRNGCAT
jgi:hypothetical protein